MEQLRTITVTGKGIKTYKPDQIIISLSYENVSKEYDEALEKAAEYTRVIKEKAVSAGADASKVTTQSFNVSRKTESRKDKDGEYHYYFVGYEVNVRFEITIPMDNRLLSEILFALREHKGNVKFRYALKDREKANEEVMELAVASALKQAKILTKAADERLGEIISINRSYGEVRFSRDYDDCDSSMLCSSTMRIAPQMDINPDDLVVNDSVNITWALR